MRFREDAFSEITDELLILAVVVILGGIIFVMVFGVVPQLPKGIFVSADLSLKQMPGYSAVALKNRGGDTLSFTGASDTSSAALVFVDTPVGSYQAVPDPALGEFRPGTTVYLYYTGTGYHIGPGLNGVAAFPQPSEDLRIRIVDPASGLIIIEWKSATYGTTKMVSPTITVPITTIPTTTITTATPTATVTILSPVTTAVPSGPILSVSWSPPGLGTISPPGITPGTVTVPDGASQTFTVSPKPQKSVLSISVDGSPVSSGGSVGQTLTYTFVNVQGGPHTLTATFG